MKILYGVQGTGNGHISRARAMAPALARRGVEVDWLFSGRAPDRLFNMEPFGAFSWRQGFSFVTVDGCLKYLRTLASNNYLRFVRDVWQLEVGHYDLVVTDFEPVSAWAGKLRGKTVVSMGHQPAFDFAVPVAGRDLATTLLMRCFAPGSARVGMHWDRFDAPLLPPLIDAHATLRPVHARKVLVYLPFENQQRVAGALAGIAGYEFYVYAPGLERLDRGSLHHRPTSLEEFRADLADCDAVVCNAGFELASECLALGKRLLVKPVERQMEQTSNALALQRLGFAAVLGGVAAEPIRNWLECGAPGTHIDFPDVADALVSWLLRADFSAASIQALSEALWARVRVLRAGCAC